MANNICLVCQKKPKRAKYQFCSKQCTDAAASRSPALLPVPFDHVMAENVVGQFKDSWDSRRPLPRIVALYLITWTPHQRKSFDDYRAKVDKMGNFPTPGNEVKRFRSEKRACQLGDSAQQLSLCSLSTCSTCRAIQTGFGASFDAKRNGGNGNGTRLGVGVYSTPVSSKSAQYAVNINGQSPFKAVIHTREVLGNEWLTTQEDSTLTAAPAGYNSVRGVKNTPSRPSVFNFDECVVYHKNSIRPAYLIIIKE